ncbi:sensor histidine kinase [Rubellimicrobium aerolatum]|uniref:histidine kinase n=1 Tax=Rubellimicrobium aerolatum TaxID=490979 RepID=A0ABW0SAJ3_9RHOB|nr:sensor histidine kinase [Rubellimicrobium aerolatum]MBP1806051.1 signal transduction histidine kinase [Rubellimicrobium aerolatum]
MTVLAPSLRPRDGLGALWARRSLATRFAWASGVVLVLATLAIGAVVTDRIEEAVVRNSANATALYMDSVIAPISQQLSDSGELSPGAERALHEILSSTPLGERIASFKFWSGDGRVIWSENRDLIGREFGLADDLRRAWGGEVVASFDDLSEEESRAEAALDLPLLEIYSPIRAVYSGRVIAVAEFYAVAPELKRDLRAARAGAWAAVATTTLLLGGVLYAIVLGGSRTIDAQRRALDNRLHDLRDLSARNHDLRLRVQAAAARAAAQADRTMRRIGADLHDGPAQHLAYVALRLDTLRERLEGQTAERDLAQVAEAVSRAMAEVRALSRGLQLPDIAGLSLPEIVEGAVEAHEARTGQEVTVRMDRDRDPPLDPAARLCVFRFLQESLGNAGRHAGGACLEVELACADRELRLTVRDRGPGLPPEPREGAMGLSGLRDRVESLGGTFTARTRVDGGAEVAMTLDLGGPAWT